MGAKLSSAPAGRIGPVSDINVTPLVDVMLVLLVVFMVAAPMMTAGVKVDLPTSSAKPLQEPKPPIVVSINAQGTIYVNQTASTAENLLALMAQEAGGDKERRIHLRGDQSLAYGRIVKTMGTLNDAGYARIALVSEAPAP